MKPIDFPKQIIYEDTGERRYPKLDEVYCFKYVNSKTGEEVIRENIIHNEYDSEYEEWSEFPENYAIYKRVK